MGAARRIRGALWTCGTNTLVKTNLVKKAFSRKTF